VRNPLKRCNARTAEEWAEEDGQVEKKARITEEDPILKNDDEIIRNDDGANWYTAGDLFEAQTWCAGKWDEDPSKVARKIHLAKKNIDAGWIRKSGANCVVRTQKDDKRYFVLVKAEEDFIKSELAEKISKCIDEFFGIEENMAD
jgi:hypothetical protein